MSDPVVNTMSAVIGNEVEILPADNKLEERAIPILQQNLEDLKEIQPNQLINEDEVEIQMKTKEVHEPKMTSNNEQVNKSVEDASETQPEPKLNDPLLTNLDIVEDQQTPITNATQILENKPEFTGDPDSTSTKPSQHPEKVLIEDPQPALVGQTRSYSQSMKSVSTIQPSKPDANENSNLKKASNQHNRPGQPGNKKKRERRQKDDNFQRNYICGCGKSYLSYAALYTHAKTKHEGVFPSGTTTLHKKKQGRPKKEEWCAVKINAEYQKTYDFNRDFVHYLDMIPGAKAEKEQSHRSLMELFPIEMFKEKIHYQQIMLKVEQIRKDLEENYGGNFLNQIDIIIYEINNAKSLNCNEIFALFLIYVFRFVSVPFYKELVFFVVAYKNMMDQKGWDKCRETNDGYPYDPAKEFCEEQNAEFAPDFANFFILDFFGQCFRDKTLLQDTAQLRFFGLESIKLLRVILLIKHFCLWLYNNKFTKAKIDIYKE